MMKTTGLVTLTVVFACGGKQSATPDNTTPVTAPVATTPADASTEQGARFGAPMGGGSAEVHAVPNDAGTFTADITVTLDKATPNTTYTLQRAPEVGRPLATDKICQRASGQFPWEQPNSKDFPPAPAFVTFEVPGGSKAPVTITTDAAGQAKTTFKFDAPMIKRGAAFDVQFRAIDQVGKAAPIDSGCFQVTPQ